MPLLERNLGLKRIMLEKKIKTTDLAKRLGVYQPFVSKMMCGEMIVRMDIVKKMSRVFNMSTEELKNQLNVCE